MAEAAHPVEGRRRGAEKSASAFRTISEVAGELDVPQHVLRFWESKFIQVRPMKRGGGRRYYRPEDIDLLRSIRELLYTDGYTIKGVQKLLREGGVKAVADRQNAHAPPRATEIPEPRVRSEPADGCPGRAGTPRCLRCVGSRGPEGGACRNPRRARAGRDTPPQSARIGRRPVPPGPL